MATLKAHRSKCVCSPIATPWETLRPGILKTTEASISHALALVVAENPSDKTYADRLKAGTILEKLFAEEPTHPGLAHYIIHAYDVPALAGRALVAAQRYAEIAPDAPHALHMPSHTFTRLGYWQESIDSNVAAAAAARRAGSDGGGVACQRPRDLCLPANRTGRGGGLDCECVARDGIAL